MKHKSEDCFVAIIDLQENFLKSVPDANHLVKRAKFLLECGKILDVPAGGTEQYPERMGGTRAELDGLYPQGMHAKMTFSACGIESFNQMVKSSGRRRVILVGVETHICIIQTAIDLINSGYEVTLALDAIGSRLKEGHSIGVQRLLQAGAIAAHTESIVYEWLESASNPKFKEVLKLVKAYAND